MSKKAYQLLEENEHNLQKIAREEMRQLKKRRMRTEIERLLRAYTEFLTLGEATEAMEALFRKWKEIL